MSVFEDAIRSAAGNMTPDNDENPAMDYNAIIIEEYLVRYSPAETFGSGVFIQTTADIINDLSDMADLTHDEVNAVLIREGYRPGRNNSGSFGWMMRQRGPRAE